MLHECCQLMWSECRVVLAVLCGCSWAGGGSEVLRDGCLRALSEVSLTAVRLLRFWLSSSVLTPL